MSVGLSAHVEEVIIFTRLGYCLVRSRYEDVPSTSSSGMHSLMGTRSHHPLTLHTQKLANLIAAMEHLSGGQYCTVLHMFGRRIVVIFSGNVYVACIAADDQDLDSIRMKAMLASHTFVSHYKDQLVTVLAEDEVRKQKELESYTAKSSAQELVHDKNGEKTLPIFNVFVLSYLNGLMQMQPLQEVWLSPLTDQDSVMSVTLTALDSSTIYLRKESSNTEELDSHFHQWRPIATTCGIYPQIIKEISQLAPSNNHLQVDLGLQELRLPEKLASNVQVLYKYLFTTPQPSALILIRRLMTPLSGGSGNALDILALFGKIGETIASAFANKRTQQDNDNDQSNSSIAPLKLPYPPKGNTVPQLGTPRISSHPKTQRHTSSEPVHALPHQLPKDSSSSLHGDKIDPFDPKPMSIEAAESQAMTQPDNALDTLESPVSSVVEEEQQQQYSPKKEGTLSLSLPPSTPLTQPREGDTSYARGAALIRDYQALPLCSGGAMSPPQSSVHAP